MEQIQEWKNKYIDLLKQNVKREGINNLIDWLKTKSNKFNIIYTP